MFVSWPSVLSLNNLKVLKIKIHKTDEAVKNIRVSVNWFLNNPANKLTL